MVRRMSDDKTQKGIAEGTSYYHILEYIAGSLGGPPGEGGRTAPASPEGGRNPASAPRGIPVGADADSVLRPPPRRVVQTGETTH